MHLRLRPARGPRNRHRRLRRRVAAATLGMAAAVTVLGASPAAAEPLGDLAGALGTSSADLPLDEILGLIPGLDGLLRPDGAAGTTRCTSVIQVGDSTSVGVDDVARVPTPDDTLTAQYKRVGATHVTLDADGGRSIVEEVGGRPNAADAVRTQLAGGARGCWVIAMGVNDAANIAVGSTVDADERIDRIMGQLAGQPVLWPTVATSNPSNSAYRAESMTSFDAALRRAVARYPNLAVYDWAAAARPAWFADGIHYTAAGTAERNRRFADALATAFPPGAGVAPATRWVAG
ncbi:SGNH/GDSL hydrolase family protein [Gordonia sp. NB41Y]|uniref:SGNH/GDSL hydrolase family protein n=1 Tax=Gordonia sp. NB41Y TaxID=875808 RepID=UPI0006B212AA|nr:SGNH/GDSL hydrolase family protein [Gordonia sp. NB41Y]EMP10925.2 hypothetical protein ISGA_4384 [Gordonia sp. NB41Y]WLP90301.1 SGNH/GDSL hydrolase family protein [Gordonia sp. NB41Y]